MHSFVGRARQTVLRHSAVTGTAIVARRAQVLLCVHNVAKSTFFHTHSPQRTSATSEESLDIPRGVTPTFHTEYNSLNDALNWSKTTPASLRLLSYNIKSPADAQLFQTALKRWRNARQPQNRTDNALFLDILFKIGAYDTILEMLCDRPGYRVLPNFQHISELMAGFRNVAVKGEGSEEEVIAVLDKVYKTFALFLYYSIPPTAEIYSAVIASGVYCGLPEGWRRSEVTAKEQISLGLPFEKEAVYALAHGYILSGDFDGALTILKHLGGADTIGLFFQFNSLTSKGDVKGAIQVLEQLAAADQTSVANMVGSAHWKSLNEVVEALLPQLNEGEKKAVLALAENANVKLSSA
ncbi:hypothetical protein SpCBS45565_g01102 [Spizellomyces sp. 'palustris']|nr:hypothetical protein SpCBS45565_g01102 [Spizellomyces sp. 'palustris']